MAPRKTARTPAKKDARREAEADLPRVDHRSRRASTAGASSVHPALGPTLWPALRATAKALGLMVLVGAAYDGGPVSPPPPLDELTRRIVDHGAAGRPVDDIMEFVAALPSELRSHFTFVHRSRSPFGGLGDRDHSSIDVHFPRAILYSGDGRLVVSFTSNPDKPGYDEAEVLRFVDDRAAFELSRFVLPAAVRRDPSLRALAAHNGEINPPECLRCHGSDVRPILDSYPMWPGFYGSVNDTFPEGSEELDDYQAFLEEQKDKGFFALLDWPAGTTVPPYIDPGHYDHRAPQGPEADLKRAPNSQLGMALGELNRKRIERKLAASPLYDKYRRGLIGVLLGCKGPPLMRADLEPVKAAIAEDNQARIDRIGFHPKGPEGFEFLDMPETIWPANIGELLYVARALGVSARDFSMGMEDGALAFYDGILSGMFAGHSFYLKEDLALEMLRRLAHDDPRFAPYFATYHVGSNRFAFGEKLNFAAAIGACRHLIDEQESRGALPNITEPLPPRPPAVAEKLEPRDPAACASTSAPMARCTSCHEGPQAVLIGRQIPLSDPALLAPRLLVKSASSERNLHDEILARMRPDAIGRMPPHGAAATRDEIEEVRRYLASIRPQQK